MKPSFFILSIFWLAQIINAQTTNTLTLPDCYTLARQNYPKVKQQQLIQKTKEYSVENISKGYLPQFIVNGQATYQSDVVTIPFELPGVVIPTLSKDQYKIYAEVSQNVFNGGNKKLEKRSAEADAVVSQQQLEVDLYALKKSINELFFGILLAQEQLLQNDLLKKDIELGLAKTNASIANGTALKSSGDALQANLLKTDQESIELKFASLAYRDRLSLFINRPLDENTVFQKPPSITPSQDINRPEIILYDAQNKALDVETELVNAKNLPKVDLFLQGGYGRPGLDMLNNDFATYYYGGLRVNWSLGGLYTAKREKALLNIKSKTNDIEKEVFLFNTHLTLRQQNADIHKQQDLIQSDNGIIQLRNRIKNTALAQLEYGVINSSDYLREVNAEDQARRTQLLHQMQLLMAQYDQQTTTGK